MNELNAIIEYFKKEKTPGPDNITTDFLKYLKNEDLLKKLLHQLNEWWERADIPEDVLLARVISLFKKGNPEKQENYRPISLLNSFYKILAKAMQMRLGEALNKHIMNNQYGFMPEAQSMQII